jgi:hypothetical protein
MHLDFLQNLSKYLCKYIFFCDVQSFLTENTRCLFFKLFELYLFLIDALLKSLFYGFLL